MTMKTLDDFVGFLPMDDSVRQQMLEGHVDVLTDLVQKDSDFLSEQNCPKCANKPCLPTIDADRPFVDGQILPRRLLHCTNCGLEFEPHTRIQTNLGGVPRDEATIATMFVGDISEDEVQ